MQYYCGADWIIDIIPIAIAFYSKQLIAPRLYVIVYDVVLMR